MRGAAFTIRLIEPRGSMHSPAARSDLVHRRLLWPPCIGFQPLRQGFGSQIPFRHIVVARVFTEFYSASTRDLGVLVLGAGAAICILSLLFLLGLSRHRALGPS